ncbi:Co2+/Mg2+ efflux protein ApaG [Hydromonas duriensis]|uniref:Uncharacterized protein affecting Mg2+/Co2+ transport n=1 Tax=Hydromonas duriensis TaxID=1527608 RepID=A0A4R6Y8E0_9BURK|nr:Co2+/Mg2+ efflux protein ApaG [Hydromonas duriensis]TDR31631.1 uncharacterized protein affecting Mg2+/Co2+ transport [Hydromonas duriensis]
MLKIKVDTAFWSKQSDVSNDVYVFVYTIQITNKGDRPVQLLSRHWIITDGFGVTREVRGDGVVGLQPLIAVNETFEYSSTCPLSTPFGTMHGEYYGVDEAGVPFIVDIPVFRLLAPHIVH